MKFSVLLPTYNRLDLLKYAIESVLQQDYRDWELIISDNQSEDDVSGYIDSLTDKRIKYSRTDTLLNVTDNWNRALSFATGDYFVMLGDDDALMPHYFTKLLAVISQFDEPEWIYTEAYEYAYPEVIPDHPEGLLIAGRNPHATWLTLDLLDKEHKTTIIQKSFQMKLGINFNMQHSLVKRTYAESLSGEFYCSLFPDYYATLAGILKAPRFLIYPEAMVIIGISKKSHGYFYVNQRMSKAKNILHSDTINREETDKIEHLLLPSMDWIEVGWVSALNELLDVYTKELANYDIKRPLNHFRTNILRGKAKAHISNQLPQEIFKLFKSSLTPREYYIDYLIPYLLFKTGAIKLIQFFKHNTRKMRQDNQELEIGRINLPINHTKTIIDVIENYPSDFNSIREIAN